MSSVVVMSAYGDRVIELATIGQVLPQKKPYRRGKLTAGGLAHHLSFEDGSASYMRDHFHSPGHGSTQRFFEHVTMDHTVIVPNGVGKAAQRLAVCLAACPLVLFDHTLFCGHNGRCKNTMRLFTRQSSAVKHDRCSPTGSVIGPMENNQDGPVSRGWS